jgi:tRNA threonylcarbamoyladenosine biosynthesis protein TsaE
VEKEKTIYVTESPAQTKKLGFLLAQAILEDGPGKRARVLALRGDLGAGKTNFTQGFAKGLGIKETINSPTFVILKKYSIKDNGGFKFFFHIDCYRLGSDVDLLQLGIENILIDSANIVVIEWPDIIKDILLKDILPVGVEVVGKTWRHVSF